MFNATHIILTSNLNRKNTNGCKCEIGGHFDSESFEDMRYITFEREGKHFSSCARESDLYNLKDWSFLE